MLCPLQMVEYNPGSVEDIQEITDIRNLSFGVCVVTILFYMKLSLPYSPSALADPIAQASCVP